MKRPVTIGKGKKMKRKRFSKQKTILYYKSQYYYSRWPHKIWHTIACDICLWLYSILARLDGDHVKFEYIEHVYKPYNKDGFKL